MKLCLLFLLIVIVIVIVYRLRYGNVEAGTCGKWQRERERIESRFCALICMR